MENSKERIYGIVGTGVFHFLILLILLVCYLRPSIIAQEPDSMGGVPVMFGNVSEARGDDEPLGRGNEVAVDMSKPIPNAENIVTTQPKTTTEKIPKGDNHLATQDMEETVAVKTAADKKAEEERKKNEALAAEERRKKAAAEQAEKEKAAAGQRIGNQIAGLFGNGTGSGSRGDSQGQGTQGVETGNASFGEKNGVGGIGGGFKLGNRKLGPGGLIRPAYNVNAEGKVIVNIRVNSKGRVTEATVGQGTTASNATLVKEALKAAERTRFNEITTNKDEIGTITYTFTLN